MELINSPLNTLINNPSGTRTLATPSVGVDNQGRIVLQVKGETSTLKNNGDSYVHPNKMTENITQTPFKLAL